jgi:hypothetical protein
MGFRKKRKPWFKELEQIVEGWGLEGSQYPNHYPCRVVKQVHTKREKANTKVRRFTKQANELSACLPETNTQGSSSSFSVACWRKPTQNTNVCTSTLPRSKGHQWWFALDCTPHTPIFLALFCQIFCDP